VIESTAGNKAPLNEETVHGRYTGVLFSAASEKKALGLVLDDMTHIKALMDNSEAFRNFL
jgi:F0F1-type ATP synthase delta subunit